MSVLPLKTQAPILMVSPLPYLLIHKLSVSIGSQDRRCLTPGLSWFSCVCPPTAPSYTRSSPQGGVQPTCRPFPLDLPGPVQDTMIDSINFILPRTLWIHVHFRAQNRKASLSLATHSRGLHTLSSLLRMALGPELHQSVTSSKGN